MNDGKGHLSCKSHTARNEKDIYRICPSKISKRELEDLYFALLEQNVQLKTTINDQKDQIKILNTRLQRMTAQKPGTGAYNKDFSGAGRGIINEQKECIADLKKDNERLSERVRLLNMRLCSAKQFLRRSPSQSASRCVRCIIPDTSAKNLSTSALNSKRSEGNLKTEISTSQLVEDESPLQLPEITSSQAEIPVQDEPCQRNKCRVEMDELKGKIASLENEMSSLQSSWSSRADELQSLLSSARAEHATCPNRLAALTTDLGGTRTLADELTSQLQLERARVGELEAQLRAARIDYNVALVAEGLKNQSHKLSDVSKVNPPVTVLSDWEDSPPIVVPNNSGISVVNEENANDRMQESADGETKNKNHTNHKNERAVALQTQGDFILTQIASLQSQLDGLKLTIGERPAESLAADSSLSHDIFSTLRLKTVTDIVKPPEPSRHDDTLVSKEFIEDEEGTLVSRPQTHEENQYEQEYKYPIPGPLSLDMPRSSLADITDIKVNNETKKRNSESSRGSKGSVRINLDNITASKNGDGRVVQDLNQNGQEDVFKKFRRSSFRFPFDRKQSKDLAVRYGQTQTYGSQEDNREEAKKVSIGINTERPYDQDLGRNDHDRPGDHNDQVATRKIRYMSEENTQVGEEPGTSVGCDETTENGAQRSSRDRNQRTNSVEIQCDGPSHTREPHTGSTKKEFPESAADEGNYVQLCSGHAVMCPCPALAPSPRSVRTCAGGLAAAPPNILRLCRCGDRVNRHTPHTSTATPEPPRPSTASPTPCPYDETVTISGPSSPDTTEPGATCDLDTQRTDETGPTDYISPGEEKATSTLSESYGTTDYSCLSEGEVPAEGGKRLSATEDKMLEAIGSRSDKMEEALRAISEELTRCRELLQGRGAVHSPKTSREVSMMTEEVVPIALKRADAKLRLRDSYTPKCIFTLHVGTVVLSDQAVLLSHDKSLLLTWRFYNQTPSMTRLLAGRVMNFDFSTEYDLKITEHFLYYLKHEEMPITISEMDKQDEAFAICSLPLRDALLHPNRRVDMSLALVAGRQMTRERGSADCEEAGVLDVWCMLRVDPSALPAINTAIIRPSSLKSQQHSSSIMEQMLDDDQSSDYRYSRDLHRRSKRTSEDVQSSRSEAMDKAPELNHSLNEVIENEVKSTIRSVNDFKQAVAKKSNDSTNIYEMLKNKKWNRRSTQNSQKPQDGSRQKSVTICNQPRQSSVNRRTISQANTVVSTDENLQSLDITIQWLALNEDCKAMIDPNVRRLYVAYTFLGRSGADMETPVSLPKPKHYMDKCHFLFKKTFIVNECDMVTLGHLAQCHEPANEPDPQCAVVFSVVSEPAEDPLGLDSCEDIGSTETYNGVLVVRDPRGVDCGALALRLDGLTLLRRCRDLAGNASH
nr:uncharacterized protein LOC116778816 isoform X3 [Danaus plexippus plexippus]